MTLVCEVPYIFLSITLHVDGNILHVKSKIMMADYSFYVLELYTSLQYQFAIHVDSTVIYTAEPLYKEYAGTGKTVLYTEVSFI